MMAVVDKANLDGNAKSNQTSLSAQCYNVGRGQHGIVWVHVEFNQGMILDRPITVKMMEKMLQVNVINANYFDETKYLNYVYITMVNYTAIQLSTVKRDCH